jgi:acetyl-CoA C-acetyltransferase
MAAMPIHPRQPVLIGVGQLTWRDGDAPEPVDLIVEAARRAAADSGATALIDRISSVRIVRLLSRGYPDPGALVAERLGLPPDTHTVYTSDGGQTPQALVDRAAEEIRRGEADVVLIAGGESWKTRNRIRARGESAPWSQQPAAAVPSEQFGGALDMTSPAETALGFTDPVQAYPMFENALRGKHGRTIAEQTDVAARLWSRFSEVAAANPNAALRTRRPPDEIATPGPDNRMIGFPYPKLMNSNSSVDQAAALLLCSAERADALGVPRDRWVFLHGAGEANDVQFVSNRWDLATSPGIRAAGAAALSLAGTGIDEVAHVDLYSCFPSAVQIAAAELGLALDRQLTVTGGLTFAGGPWNAYVLFSIATMAGVLREHPDELGLVSANGGLLTKHAVGLYGCHPPALGTRVAHPEVTGADRKAVHGFHGPVTVDAYTVMHDKDGEPERAFVSGLLADGRRTMVASDDGALMATLLADGALGARLDV